MRFIPSALRQTSFKRSAVALSAGLVLAVAGFAAPDAQARDHREYRESGHHDRKHHVSRDHRHHDRGYHHNHRSDKPRVSFNISLGNHSHHAKRHRHYDRGYDRGYNRGYRHGHHHANRGGYFKRVWVAPVYGFRYASCGTRYRVVIRSGYYKSVWVSHHRGGGYGSCRY